MLRKTVCGTCPLLIALLLISCEENVTAVTGTEKAFSFYGVLSPRMDTQFVRIYPIENRLTEARSKSLRATVRLTNQTDGRTYRMRDSIITEPNGRFAHVFWVPHRANYDQTYRIEAANRQGEITTAEVDVPPKANIQLQEAETLGGVRLPILIEGEVPRLLHVAVHYIIKFAPGTTARTVDTLAIDYDGRAERTTSGWELTVYLGDDYEKLRSWCLSRNCWSARRGEWGLNLIGMQLRFAVVNGAWNPPHSERAPGVHQPPGTRSNFDPEVLVQPGTMSNVENGFGFVGAGYRMEREFRPDSSVLEKAGFRPL